MNLRGAGHAGPLRILHLGLGSFHRAHQATYLQDLRDGGDLGWRPAAGQLRPDNQAILQALARQQGRYTLETVTPQGERSYREIRCLDRVVPFDDAGAELLAPGADPDTRIVSFTVTEAGYALDARNRLDLSEPAIAEDVVRASARRMGRTIYGALVAPGKRRTACTYRIAFGPRAGQKVLTRQGAMPRETDFKQSLCADIDGFGLHAAVRCGADERQGLEQLCRGITRPALANERVQTNAAGPVVLELKTPWRDGTTHLVMSPLEFMQRLAALVPRPRLHLIRFHGVVAVVAPNAKLRALVVPQEPEQPAQAAPPAECEAPCTQHRRARLSWARLLERVFEIDMEHCPNCGGQLKIIAAILEQPVIQKILTHLGLQARAPPRAPARGSQLQAA